MDRIAPEAAVPPGISRPQPASRAGEGAAEPVDAGSVVRWLYASAVCVVLTLVIGGGTRLTEAGLSITQWQPVSGVLPPLNDTDWGLAFQRYLAIPEAQTVHRGITLEQFKVLFWWEWAHRLIARVAGLVIALPFLWLLFRRRLPRPLIPRLLSLPLLVAAQGVLGWYMVTSGLSERTDVSQYRLVAHLGLALVIYVIAVWTAMSLQLGVSGERAGRSTRPAVALATLTFITILSGGFVAGLDAGHIYNTFPMMGASLVPAEYGQLTPAWRNWFENPAAVQFNHRVLATVVLTMAAWLWARARRASRTAGERRAWNVIGVTAVIQVTLGIATLLLRVPIPVAALHQLGAVALLTAALWAAAVRRAPTT